jgi:hypothetical protein
MAMLTLNAGPPPQDRFPDVEQRLVDLLPPAASSSATIVQLQAQRLKALATRLEDFVAVQCDRLRGARQELAVEGPSPPGTTPTELNQLLEEFEQMRNQWEQNRSQEVQRLKEDAARLVEAWQRLEAEQRQILSRQASARALGMPVERLGIGALHPARSAESGGVSSPLPAIDANAATPLSAYRSTNQFQQLRRELQRHAQQQRKR